MRTIDPSRLNDLARSTDVYALTRGILLPPFHDVHTNVLEQTATGLAG